jgi:AAA domain
MSDLSPTPPSPQSLAAARHSASADNESLSKMNASPPALTLEEKRAEVQAKLAGMTPEEREAVDAEVAAKRAQKRDEADKAIVAEMAARAQANRPKANGKQRPKEAAPDPWDWGEQPSSDGSPKPAQFKLIDWNDIQFDPNEEWLVEDVLPMRGFGLVYGKPRSFKSFTALDLVLHVAQGTTWAGKRVEKGKVLYIAAEGAAGMRKRAEAYRKKYSISRGDFALIEVAPNLGAAEGDLQGLIASAASAGFSPHVIVIDTASKSIGAAEENSAGMAAFVLNSGKLADHFGCLVLAVHHVGLGEEAQKRPRGWSGLGGALDVQILCERPGDEMRTTLTIQKLKDEADGVCFEAHLSRVVVGVDKYGKEASTLLVDDVLQIEAAAGKAAVAKSIPQARRLLMDIVALALDEKGADIRPCGFSGPKVRAVADKDIRERYFARVAEKAAPDEDERKLYDRQLKAFNRSMKAAIDAKTLIAGEHQGERFVWSPQSP